MRTLGPGHRSQYIGYLDIGNPRRVRALAVARVGHRDVIVSGSIVRDSPDLEPAVIWELAGSDGSGPGGSGHSAVLDLAVHWAWNWPIWTRFRSWLFWTRLEWLSLSLAFPELGISGSSTDR